MRFRSVVLDVDSTAAGLEGIDWLAALRGPDTARRVEELTNSAMAGEKRLEDVYNARLDAIRPTLSEIRDLGEAYISAVAGGAREAVNAFRSNGIRVFLISGGIIQAVLPLAELLGVSVSDVRAVRLHFDPDGCYLGLDADSPLIRQDGKRTIVEQLGLPRPSLAVGDGATDLEMAPAVSEFAAFTQFASRPAVVAGANHVVASFTELTNLVLG